MGYLLAAIIWLAPTLPHAMAEKYAEIIHRESEKAAVDPLLVAAIIQVESGWRTRAKSATADWGLMQVHVSKTTNPHLLGKEEVLFDPEVGIRYGVKTLVMWRRWHSERCLRKRPHFSWSHYQWGYRVRNLEWSLKVRDLYQQLRERFKDNELEEFEGV